MTTKTTLIKASQRFGLVLFATTAMLGDFAMAQTTPGAVALTPGEMKWASQGGLAAPGMQQLNLIGDPAKPGPYTLRLKFPKGFRIAPHSHPDYREVTILSGTFATGYGDKFDTDNLKILPSGSFYTEPPGMNHFAMTKGEGVVIQITGYGPTGTTYVDPRNDPTKKP